MRHPWHIADEDLYSLIDLFLRSEAARDNPIRWETDCRSILLRVMAQMAFRHSNGGER